MNFLFIFLAKKILIKFLTTLSIILLTLNAI